MSTTSAWRLVQRYAQQTGIGPVNTHTFRWFVGSELMRRRGLGEAQRALGHRRAAALVERYGRDEPGRGVTDGLY
jgi:integrase